jgi:hypothetical protein
MPHRDRDLVEAEPCERQASVMPPTEVESERTLSVIWASAPPASRTRTTPASTSCVEPSMSWRIERAESPVCCASRRTSSATTAKPRPASPARAASTEALRARRLVWKAIE